MTWRGGVAHRGAASASVSSCSPYLILIGGRDPGISDACHASVYRNPLRARCYDIFLSVSFESVPSCGTAARQDIGWGSFVTRLL